MYRCLLLVLSLLVNNGYAEQLADAQLNFSFDHPAYAANSGPRVAIDAGHNNFHTAPGRFQAFTKVLQADGYRVISQAGESNSSGLEKVDILVIANALHATSVDNWSLQPQSAFTNKEVAVLNLWVANGGSILLIADHQPFPGAAYNLAYSFGFKLYNGYTLDRTRSTDQGQLSFTRADNTLPAHEITQHIDFVTTFLGQAFLAPASAQPLLRLDNRHHLFLPLKAGMINKTTRHIPVENWLQGATLKYGKGRLIVLGEAGGLTAQTQSKSGKRFGLAHPAAVNNVQFIRNMFIWLQPQK
jgi:hypothetical protein